MGTEHSGLPPEIVLAEECSAALDRRDLEAARAIAERGLQLATATRSPKWVRRFQHLLDLCTPQPQEASQETPIVCSFCLGESLGAWQVVAGPRVFICRGCVAGCVDTPGGSAALQRLILKGVRCAFCNRVTDDDPAVYAARGHYICVQCVRVCVEIFADARSGP
jgi:hypothetical protein